jgi:hypothetical protein
MSLVTPNGHGLGAKPSPRNPKFLGFPAHLFAPRTGTPPPRFFVTGALGPVKNQGQQGSCTAHGATSQGERLYRRFKNQAPIFAPAFHYYIERQIEGTLAQGDVGAQVSTSLIVGENPVPAQPGGNGFCPETLMPYNDADCSTPPSPTALSSALKSPGGSWHSLGNDIDNIKSCILSDYTGVIGISVYDSFEADPNLTSGLIPYPNVNVENCLGGHETHSMLGYDDTIQCPSSPNPGAVLSQNSWGPLWGIAPPVTSLSTTKGFYWISYDYLLNPNLTSDVRMQHLGKAW